MATTDPNTQTKVERPGAAPLPRAIPQVPDHQLLRRIGEGSYGEVWLARNVMGAYRAVKVVYRASFASDRPYAREFSGIEKFEPISRSHDGLVDILQVGRNDPAGYFYYVMELADDAHFGPVPRSARTPVERPAAAPEFHPENYTPKTLASELSPGRRLSVETCLPLALSLTSALGYLHGEGLIHRDIKPSNIIFVRGTAQLADIGLVADVGEARSYVGTEGFIPPEGPGTAQADVYSFGKVLYQMCTGKDRQDFPALPSDLDEAPGHTTLLGLNNIVLRACAGDPAQRYASAAEMHTDLLALQAGEAPSPKRAVGLPWASLLPQRTKSVARNTLAVLAILLLFLAGLSFLAPWPHRSTSALSAATVLSPMVAALPSANVLQQAYGGFPPPSSAAAAPPRLQLEIAAKRHGDTNFTTLEDGAILASEIDLYVIVARPLSPGYLYMFQVDSAGKLQWLFPQNPASSFSSGSNPVLAQHIVKVPAASHERLYLDHNTGIEHVYAVFSATRWPALEQALANPAPISPSRGSKVLPASVQEPNGLKLRGVGGTRVNDAISDAEAVALEQIDQGQKYKLPLSSLVLEASGSPLAVERWFRHVDPPKLGGKYE